MTNILRRGYTDQINRHTAENICHAVDYAKYKNMPLNRYVVINFAVQRVLEPTTLFTSIRKKYRIWLKGAYRRMGQPALPPVYVYTHENPDGHPHVNWMVHVPPSLHAEFERKLESWVRKVLGAARPFDISNQAIDPFRDKRLTKYLIKGIDPAFIDYLHLQEVAMPQGRIFGRRATASPAISRKARKDAGFVPRLHRHLWKQDRTAA